MQPPEASANKFNPYHDALGRFTFAPDGAAEDGGSEGSERPQPAQMQRGRQPPATLKPGPNPPIPPGKQLRNKDLAGKRHPDTNVPFDKDGFPDFSEHVKKSVQVEHKGTRADIDAANKAAGFEATPKGMAWHYHQDGRTMQLVPEEIHGRTGHTGSKGIGNLPGRKDGDAYVY